MYKTRELEINEVPCLGIILDEYPTTVFIVGGVQFLEENETLRLKFDYNIIEGPTPDDLVAFQEAIGKFIEYYIEQNPENIVYTGGT